MVQKIILSDNYRKNIHDVLSTTVQRPKGQVLAYDKKPDGTLEKILDTSNLIVYQGREWLIQRALNQALSGDTHNSPGSFISWFGLGTGGASASILIPLVPLLTDTELYTPIIINDKTGTPCINDGKLHPLDEITLTQDPANNNKYLIASIQINIGADDADGPLGGSSVSDYYDINEAGLYVSDSRTQSDFTGPDAALHLATIQLFARTTFSTIRKYSERSIVFIWNIYF